MGSGPAGLSCAHALRRLGHEVIVFEARGVPGGLDTLGIAAYKISTEFALSEIERIRQIGIDIELNHRVDGDEVPGIARVRMTPCFSVSAWVERSRCRSRAKIWRGSGNRSTSSFRPIPKPLDECEVGQDVVVIGAGNTAIDVATAAKRLGAEG